MVQSGLLTVAVLAAMTTALAAAPGPCAAPTAHPHACCRSAGAHERSPHSCRAEVDASPTLTAALPAPCHCLHEPRPPAVEEGAVHSDLHLDHQGLAATAGLEREPPLPRPRIEPPLHRLVEATGPPLYTTACALLI